ncbi:MAG: hypothetical protein ACI4DX_06030 [Oliverpabstia sp.]
MSVAKKIIDLEERKKYKSLTEDKSDIDPIEQFDDICRKLREVIVNSEKNLQNSHFQKRIVELENEVEELKKENAAMKNKLGKSIPIHIIIYMVICALVISVSITLLIFRYKYKIYTIDPYYIISALLIALTLFFTSMAAIKDWKEFLNER